MTIARRTVYQDQRAALRGTNSGVGKQDGTPKRKDRATKADPVARKRKRKGKG